MKKLLLLEEELAASGNCEHWVKLEFSDGDYIGRCERNRAHLQCRW